MFIILPAISWIFLYLIFYKKDNCWRSAILSAAIVWGVLVTGITESLSLVSRINFEWCFLLWLLTDIVLSLLCIREIRRTKTIAIAHDFELTIQPFHILLLISVAFIALAVGVIAIIAPPNNWDSMSYHMPRVVHWIQNHNVAHYPTSYTPQLYQPPWAEFAIMHFQILSGGDHFANLVQWFSMIGSLIGVSLIAKQLKADLQGQVLSVVVCATIPMGILQASSTQTDYVLSFWLICFVHYILSTLNVKILWIHLLKISASLGLAILTKGTAYIYALPFFLWFVLLGVKKIHWKILKHCLTAAAIVTAINLGHYTRNFYLFGSPISTLPQKYTNDAFSVPIFLSNVIRNAGLHMAIPLDVVDNEVIEKAIKHLHTIIGINVNDPRTTWPDTAFSIQNVPTFEDTAGNPIHFWLIFFITVFYIISGSFKKNIYCISYLTTALSSFLLFCFLLKWQPWHSRVHLPIFVLLAPSLGIFLSDMFIKCGCAKYFMIVLIQVSLVFVFCNENKPVIAGSNIFNSSRIEQYFSDRSSIKDAYINAVKFVEKQECGNIGLSLRPEAWEYPLWVLLEGSGDRRIRLEHINVENISNIKSNTYSFNNFIPCAIVSVGPMRSARITNKQNTYVKAWQSLESIDPVKVFAMR